MAVIPYLEEVTLIAWKPTYWHLYRRNLENEIGRHPYLEKAASCKSLIECMF